MSFALDPESAIPEEILRAFDTAGAAISPLPAGRMNRHWLVETAARKVVLRRYSRLRTRLAIEWEQALVRHAGSKGWPVPVPIPAGSGETVLVHDSGLWSAMPFLEGAPRESTGAAAYRITGRLLGRFHRDLSDFPVEGQRPGLGKTWELDVLVEPAGAGTFNALLAALARDHADLAAKVRRQRYRNLRELARLHYPDLPDRPIHGDFHRSNLLFSDGELTGVLDFDQCRLDALACDLAPLLVPFQPLEIPHAAALLDGYQAVRPLSDLEWAILPALGRASLLWWVAFLLATWRVTGSEAALEGIARTANERFPALDAWEPEFRRLYGRATSP